MAFWKRKNKKAQTEESVSKEVLYLTEEGDVSTSPLAAPASLERPVAEANAASGDPVTSEPLIVQGIVEQDDTREESSFDASSGEEALKAKPAELESSLSKPKAMPGAHQAKAQKAAVRTKAKAEVSARKEKASTNRSDVENWRKGAKGRPVQVFIGFLSNGSKKDAISSAIGVAERNADNVANTAYAVFPWNGGWAYEVHEGGPCRAYLPAILRFFDGQGEYAKLDELVVTISTARRSVRVERTHTGLVSFQMPETFEGEQTAWLEPGPRLKPAVPVRLGVLAAGAAIFATGFITMLTAYVLRPEPPVVTAHRIEVPYEQLPISLWPTLLKASATGYVSALQYSNGRYTFSIAGQSQPVEAVVTPPPLPAPKSGAN